MSHPLFRDKQSRERLAAELADHIEQESGLLRQSDSKVDTFGAGWQARSSISAPGLGQPLICFGRVVDVVPAMNGYRVQGEYGGVYNCTLGGLSGFQPSGPRQLNTLPVGCGVYFIMHPQALEGTIFCVDPDFSTDPKNLRSDYITQGGRTGLMVDSAHYSLINRLMSNGGFSCKIAGRPMDSTSGGEWGYITETGLAVFMDPFQAFMRVDEETGLYLFYHDQLARLAGHNLQIRSALGALEHHDDQGELNSIYGETPYPFEALGAFNGLSTNYKEFTSEVVQSTNPEYSLLEPLYDDQQPFDRKLKFGGYLGQLGKEITCIPPYYPDEINRYSTFAKFIGVLNQQQGMSGAYGIESAKRIYITKRISIPVPKQVVRPEDQRGDNETNYKAAGLSDNGPVSPLFDHTINEDFDVGFSLGPTELVGASSVLDLGAFTFNWMGIHPFFYHSLDWYVPEECELSVVHVPQDFCALRELQYLTAPDPIIAAVDHRLPAVNYYPNESFQVFLDDGGIVVGDGFGAEIRMTAGSLTISAPGDINIMPGKNFNVWAGWDAITKANNSVDLSANQGDVTLKAEYNMKLLSGNSGLGGTIIENRATYTGYSDFTEEFGEDALGCGIVFSSRKAPVASLSSDYIVKVRKETTTFGSGNIYLDTDKDIKLLATNIYSFCDKIIEYFNDGASANEFGDGYALFDANLRVNGSGKFSDGVEVLGWITAVNGHFSSTDTATYNGQVTILNGTKTLLAQGDINKSSVRTDYLKSTLYNAQVSPQYYIDVKNKIENVDVSMRTPEQYKTQDFAFFETRWQQLARLGLGKPAVWEEAVVECNAGETMPYPGLEIWTGEASWYEQDLRLFSIQDGNSVNRATNLDAYQNPAFGTTNVSGLDGNYTIIMNC